MGERVRALATQLRETRKGVSLRLQSRQLRERSPHESDLPKDRKTRLEGAYNKALTDAKTARRRDRGGNDWIDSLGQMKSTLRSATFGEDNSGCAVTCVIDGQALSVLVTDLKRRIRIGGWRTSVEGDAKYLINGQEAERHETGEIYLQDGKPRYSPHGPDRDGFRIGDDEASQTAAKALVLLEKMALAGSVQPPYPPEFALPTDNLGSSRR